MDFSRLRQGEIIAAIGGLALFIFMFLPWFGFDVPDVEIPDVPGVDEGSIGTVSEVDSDISAWDGLTDIDGFLIAAAAFSGMALGGLAAAGKRLNLGGIRRGSITAILGSLAVALILWRLLANPADLKYGIFLGLAAAIAIAVGAILALREDGIEPLASVAGGRTRTAAASAPAATPRRASSAPKRATRSSSSSGSGSRSTSSRSKSSGSRSKSSGTRKTSTTRRRASGGKK